MGGVKTHIPRGVDMTSSGTTTDDYVAVLTWECVGIGKKHIRLTNNHVANGLKYKVLTYLSNSIAPLAKEFVSETTLAATATDEFVLDRSYSKIVIYAKAAVGAAQATYQIDFTGGQA